MILCHQYDLSVIGLACVTKCFLMNLEQVRLVRSARLLEFVWMLAYCGGSRAAAPDSGVRGGSHRRGTRGSAPGWGRQRGTFLFGVTLLH